MDIFIYNTSLDLCGVVDEISSLIWHRRFFKAGYFKLVAPATPNNTNLLVKHNIIEKENSTEVGFISNVVLTNDDNGEFISISGYFLSGLLENRVIITPDDDFLSLIDKNIASSALSSRSIPNLFVDKKIQLNSDYHDDLYGYSLSKYAENFCMAKEIGLRVKFLHNPEKHLMLEAFYGVDRSVMQRENPQIIFSYEYDNLLSAKYQYSENNAVNTVYTKAIFDAATECSGSPPSFIAGDENSGFGRIEGYLKVPAITFTYDRSICTGFSGTTPTFTTIKVTAVNKIATQNLLSNEGVNAIVLPSEIFTGNVLVDDGYKTEYDLGDIVTIWHEKWQKAISQRITEITEIYQNGSVTIEPIFGSQLPTLSDIFNTKKAR